MHHAIWTHPEDQKRIIEHGIPVNSTPNFSTTFGGGKLDNTRLIGEERIGTSLGRYPISPEMAYESAFLPTYQAPRKKCRAPLYVIACATTLLDLSDPESVPFPPQMKPMTVEQAIRAMTIDAAWQLRMDDKVGSLEVGKYADIVVLESNPFDVEPKAIADIKVLGTMMDGRFTHRDGL